MDKYGYPSELFIRLNARLCVCRSRSEKFNIPFSLVLEDIKNVIDKPCTYCGKTEKIQIDRKTPELGYVTSNIVPACSRCNRIKANDISHDDMIKLAEYLGWKSVLTKRFRKFYIPLRKNDT
jgi:hypothetical protein